MMKTTKLLYARAGATAIAAVLALSSTPLAAQEAPTPTEPVATTPAPDPVPTAPATTPATDPLAPTEATTTEAPSAAKATTAKRSAAAKRPAATAAKPSAKTAARSTAAAAAAPAAAAPVAATPTPVVDTAPAADLPVPSAKPVPAAANGLDETTLELGAGALAILALGAAAVAMSRRRRRVTEEETHSDEAYEPVETVAAVPAAEPMGKPVTASITATPRHDPVEPQPLIVAPPLSAFNWGDTRSTTVAKVTDRVASAPADDRDAGETWVERAQRGPTPDNPSLSLRKRLKRAAFFDKREREVAAGTAPKVDPDAGLPESMDTRELEHA